MHDNLVKLLEVEVRMKVRWSVRQKLHSDLKRLHDQMSHLNVQKSSVM